MKTEYLSNYSILVDFSLCKYDKSGQNRERDGRSGRSMSRGGTMSIPCIPYNMKTTPYQVMAMGRTVSRGVNSSSCFSEQDTGGGAGLQ